MTRFILLLFLTVSAGIALAQHPFIESFKLEQAAGGVFIRWTLKQGSICQGIQIERRSSNQEEFIEVGNIEGVCGDVSAPVDYSFLDSNPLLGQENRYRIMLGGNGASDEQVLFVHDFKKEEYVLLQDPAGQFIRLLPRRTGLENRNYHVYAIQGSEQMNGKVEVATDTLIPIQGLMKGVYLLIVTGQGEELFSSTFLKFN